MHVCAGPDNAHLILVGDFDPQTIQDTVKEHFLSWSVAPSQPATPPRVPTSPVPPRSSKATGTLYFVNVPGATQAAVAMAEPGVRLSSPDRASLDVLTSLLNSFGGATLLLS